MPSDGVAIRAAAIDPDGAGPGRRWAAASAPILIGLATLALVLMRNCAADPPGEGALPPTSPLSRCPVPTVFAHPAFGPGPLAACPEELTAWLARRGCAVEVPTAEHDELAVWTTGCTPRISPLPGAHRLALGIRVNVNTATAADLEALPGIGPVLARRIVEHRGRVGIFDDVGALRAVRGIGPKTVRRLRRYLAANGSSALTSPKASSSSPAR